MALFQDQGGSLRRLIGLITQSAERGYILECNHLSLQMLEEPYLVIVFIQLHTSAAICAVCIAIVFDPSTLAPMRHRSGNCTNVSVQVPINSRRTVMPVSAHPQLHVLPHPPYRCRWTRRKNMQTTAVHKTTRGRLTIAWNSMHMFLQRCLDPCMWYHAQRAEAHSPMNASATH